MAPPPPRELTEALQRAASGEGEPPPLAEAGHCDGTFSDDHKVLARVLPRIANNLNGLCDGGPVYDCASSSDDSDDGLTASERRTERRAARETG